MYLEGFRIFVSYHQRRKTHLRRAPALSGVNCSIPYRTGFHTPQVGRLGTLAVLTFINAPGKNIRNPSFVGSPYVQGRAVHPSDPQNCRTCFRFFSLRPRPPVPPVHRSRPNPNPNPNPTLTTDAGRGPTGGVARLRRLLVWRFLNHNKKIPAGPLVMCKPIS